MASISRFGRAISSGSSVSDNSFASSASVSSAVWSSRFAKSVGAVPVVIKNSSRSVRAGQSFMAAASSIPAGMGLGRRLKRAGKTGTDPARYASDRPLRRLAPRLEPEIVRFAHCPKSAADRAGGAVAAVSAGAVLSRRPSGLDADGLALADRRAGVAAMDRFRRDFAGAAALGGGLRGRQILQPPRHRLGRAARGDRRRGGRRGGARRLDHHPAGGEEPVPVAGPQRGPQGPGDPAGDVDRSGAAESSGSWKSISTSPNWARPASSAPKRGPSTPSAAPPPPCRRGKRRFWRRSCPIRSGAAPAIPAPGCAAWPGPIWPGRRPRALQRCWRENRAF